MAECSHNEQIVLCRINISLGRAGGGGGRGGRGLGGRGAGQKDMHSFV